MSTTKCWPYGSPTARWGSFQFGQCVADLSARSSCSFDEWAANNSVNEPGAWAGKKDTAVGRFTNFPTGYRAPSRRGEVGCCIV